MFHVVTRPCSLQPLWKSTPQTVAASTVLEAGLTALSPEHVLPPCNPVSAGVCSIDRGQQMSLAVSPRCGEPVPAGALVSS